MRFIHSLANAVFFAAVISSSIAAEIPTGLDGATGDIFKVDPTTKSFVLLKATEYAPKSDIGKSRFTVYWDGETRVTQVEQVKNFAGIKGPVAVDFHGIDNASSKALVEGKSFVARVAIVDSGAKSVSGIAPEARGVTAWFTPNETSDARSGFIEMNGKKIAVSMRKNNSQIFHRQPLRPEQLAKGFWQTTIHGADVDGRFIVSNMEVTVLEDPRATDDPKLPRVLVIGDSVSMNYEAAAKAALKGVANFHRNEGNSFSSVHGVSNAELWLGNYQEPGRHWDVIQFNHGLHDLKQAYDMESDTFGEYAVPLELYKASLEKEIAILKKTGAVLIWCTTTPVQTDMKSQYARRKGAAKIYNEAAAEVMKKHPEILIDDLHAVVDSSPIFDDWRKTSDVHFYKPEEQKALGEAVAKAVRKALKRESENK